jgi:Lrp/AsnC family transcriptional regulator, leucine-responsive regulatory protein
MIVSMESDDSFVLDGIDRRILGEVSQEGRITIRDLGERIALSCATSERLRRLEERGVITGYRADLNAMAIGRPIDAVIGVRTLPAADRQRLETWLAAQPSIVEAVHLTGQHDYLVRARFRDPAELDVLLMTMKSDAGVADTETRIVLRSLPVPPVRPS